VIATDPINAAAAIWLENEIRTRFGQEIRYVVYSHDHAGNISGGEVWDDTAVVVAHANARQTIIDAKRSTAVPELTFTDQMTLNQTRLDDVMTDEPVGTPMSDLDPPALDQIEGHIRFIETDGVRGQPADLSGVDMRLIKLLVHLNLASLRARKVLFYGLDMRGVKLQGANLEHADMRTTNLEGADLRGTNLNGANLSGAVLRDCNMGPLVIDESRRLPTQLRDARLQRADMRGADLAQAVLDGVDWAGSRRSGASFDGASMQNMRDNAST